MRQHIAKSLQRRCQAIRTALREYNNAAQALNPPKPPLDWSKVSHYTFLDEFNLLRNTRQDIQSKRWADLVVRETMKQHQKIKRAQEEIYRCNVEVRRLHTAIVDELNFFTTRLPEIQQDQPLIYGAVKDYFHRRRQVNVRLLGRLSQIHALKGFTGNSAPGVRKGQTTKAGIPAAGSSPEIDELVDDEDFVGDMDQADDLVTREVEDLVNFLSGLSIGN